jgi:hypothetical protein
MFYIFLIGLLYNSSFFSSLQKDFCKKICRFEAHIKSKIYTMSYYKEIDGKKYDRQLLELAEKLVQGQGDGRISMDDAKKLLQEVKDGDKYTDIEKDTMAYIRDNFNWTDEADEWFRTEIRKWAATK